MVHTPEGTLLKHVLLSWVYRPVVPLARSVDRLRYYQTGSNRDHSVLKSTHSKDIIKLTPIEICFKKHSPSECFRKFDEALVEGEVVPHRVLPTLVGATEERELLLHFVT